MKDLAPYLDAAAALVDLPISPEHRAATLTALAMIMDQAALVLAFPLPPETEAAPRFRP